MSYAYRQLTRFLIPYIQFAQAVDYYLTPVGEKHIPEMYRIANLPSSAESDALLLGYCMEGIRLAGTFGSYREAAVDDVVKEDDGREVLVKAQERVFVSFVSNRTVPPRLSPGHLGVTFAMKNAYLNEILHPKASFL